MPSTIPWRIIAAEGYKALARVFEGKSVWDVLCDPTAAAELCEYVQHDLADDVGVSEPEILRAMLRASDLFQACEEAEREIEEWDRQILPICGTTAKESRTRIILTDLRHAIARVVGGDHAQ